MRLRTCLFALVAACLAVPVAAPANASDDVLWEALAGGGHVLLLRQAEPSDASAAGEVCEAGPYLTDAGGAAAERLGAVVRERGVAVSRVRASMTCAAQETAARLALGPVDVWPSLNSWADSRPAGVRQSREIETYLRSIDAADALVVLVTHEINIFGLSGLKPKFGTGVVLRLEGAGRYGIAGTLD